MNLDPIEGPSSGTTWPKESAIRALRAAAFHEPDEVEYLPANAPGPGEEQLYRRQVVKEGRDIVHCYAGPFGADWDLDDAIREVEGAERVEWVNHLMGHNLATSHQDARGIRRRYFDVGGQEP